jgi:hypothetical protein
LPGDRFEVKIRHNLRSPRRAGSYTLRIEDQIGPVATLSLNLRAAPHGFCDGGIIRFLARVVGYAKPHTHQSRRMRGDLNPRNFHGTGGYALTIP